MKPANMLLFLATVILFFTLVGLVMMQPIPLWVTAAGIGLALVSHLFDRFS